MKSRLFLIAAILATATISLSPGTTETAAAACVGLIEPGLFECPGGCEVYEAGIGAACGGGLTWYALYIEGGGHVAGVCVGDLLSNPAGLCTDHLGNECVAVIWIVNDEDEQESVFVPPCF